MGAVAWGYGTIVSSRGMAPAVPENRKSAMSPLTLLIVIASICLVVTALGLFWGHRRRQQVMAMIADRGGEYISWGLSGPGARLIDVKYIAADGDLRLAGVSFKGGLHIVTDRPYQTEMKEKLERASSTMDKLVLIVACMRLPGYEAFLQMVRELAQGSTNCVVVKEDAAPARTGWRFAPILQCIECHHILPHIEPPDAPPTQTAPLKAASERVLEMEAYGRRTDISWEVKGDRPHRSLLLMRAR